MVNIDIYIIVDIIIYIYSWCESSEYIYIYL